jgi:FHA domain-containing protein
VQPFALEADDRAFALARAGRVLASSPSAVFDGSAGTGAGEDAWRALRALPGATSTRHLASVLREAQPAARALSLVAAELARRLAPHALNDGERIWIAAPALAGPSGLGALLGVARHLALPLDGFVDAALVTATALGSGRPAIVVELGLHHLAATLIEHHGGPAGRSRALLSERSGLLPLAQAWLELINTAMVRQTRFDALRDAASEQQLFDALPELARAALTSGAASAALAPRGERIEVTLSRDQLAQAGEGLWRELTRLLHGLRPAGSELALILPQALAALPGLGAVLAQFAGCEVLTVPEGFAAAATSLLDLPPRAPAEPVRLLRRLPGAARELLAQLAPLARRESAGASRPARPVPSHLLYAGRTYLLGAQPLIVGRAPGAAHALTLAEGLAGVSRRHCSFVRDGAELLLLDHSRFGTFLNEERVAERARVAAGDEVRVGDPGVRLALIAVEDRPRAAGAG